MTLGNRIKQLRQEGNLSQPEFAEKAGIEQSYLSKLENDKSVPSNDIFNNVLQAFGISLDNFMHGHEWSGDLNRIRQIPDIDQWFKAQSQQDFEKQRRYLYACSALIVLAITLFYVGYSKQVFDETYYQYVSSGVILEGESKHIFQNWDDHINLADHNAMREMRVKMNKRFDEIVVTHNDDTGQHYVVDVKGGQRFFKKYKEIQQPRKINAWLQILGVFLLAAGAMGFVIERKLFSKM